jgi:hypothetical protein
MPFPFANHYLATGQTKNNLSFLIGPTALRSTANQSLSSKLLGTSGKLIAVKVAAFHFSSSDGRHDPRVAKTFGLRLRFARRKPMENEVQNTSLSLALTITVTFPR